MADGIVFTESTVTLLKNWIGDAIKPKVPFILRAIVKPAIGIALNVVNKYADRIPFIVKINHNELLSYPNHYDQTGLSLIE